MLSLGPTDGWGAAHIVAMLVVGVSLLAAFVYWETVFPNPLMPPHIWRDRNFTFVSAPPVAREKPVTDVRRSS